MNSYANLSFPNSSAQCNLESLWINSVLTLFGEEFDRTWVSVLKTSPDFATGASAKFASRPNQAHEEKALKTKKG